MLGSTVQLSAISSSGSPTGTVFNTATTDDLGDFNVTFSYLGYVDMQASGFYYDEVTGALSTAPILLRALYDVKTSGPQNAYINIVTHLAHDRAVSLMGGDAGVTLEAAEAQAETELFTALGIGGTGFSPGGVGVNLNELGTDNDSNAYLFAVSAIMVETVIQQSGTGSLDANLQELLDTVASDLVASGTLPPTVTSEILSAEEILDVDLTMDLFSYRLQSIGSTATPANLDRAVDSDGDGYRNTVDTCPLVANPVQSVIPPGVLCSVTRHTTLLPAPPVVTSIPILVADFENTGHPGALVPRTVSWSLLLGDGAGRFAAPVAVTLPASFAPQLAYDINKDGNLDLVSLSGWVAGDGKGHFGALAPFSTLDAGGLFGGPVAVGDFNGDGIPDVAGFSAGGVASLLGTSPGVFGSPISSPAPFGGGSPGSWLFAFDVNDDGNLDLVAMSTANALALLGNGKGDFQAGTAVALNSVGGAAVADVDGDGNLDVAGSDGSSSVQVAFGDGNGGFGSVATTSVGSAEVAVGDYNSDGKSDLWVGYASSPCSAKVSVLLSQGKTFGPPQALDATPGACSPIGFLVSHDLNGDGTPDVALLNQDADGTWSLQGYVVGDMPDYVCGGKICNGACVDTTSNWFNCSKCGDSCALGATCSGGVCDCNGMDAVCGDACVDKRTNIDNCGACGKACTATSQSCVGGKCVCPGTHVVCGGACVDESSDNNNCGTCGKICSAVLAGSNCTGSLCVCFGSQVPCGGACVDESSDNNNCGACGNNCALVEPGSICTAGSCLCPGSEVTCSGACVDESTDNANCGACGTACSAVAPSTAQCTGGRCLETLASGLPGPGWMAIDSTSVYWINYSGTTLMKVALDGGSPTTLATGLTFPSNDIAVDSTSVYWTECSAGVKKVNLGGGSVTTLASGTCAYGITVDSTTVYWTENTIGGRVMSVPIGGGTPTSLASGPNYGASIAVDSTSVYWLDGWYKPPGYVMKVPLAGGAVTTLASGSNDPFGIAVDSTHVYWADEPGGAVISVPLAGGSTSTLATGFLDADGVVVDAATIYWIAYSTGVVMSAPLGGGTPTTLITGQSPVGIAVDATSLYWTNNVSGTVMKLTPK